MISSLHKFPLRTDFVHFRSRCQKISYPHLTMCYESSTLSSRLAVIVPKKLSKLATTRNWLKRLALDTLWPVVKEKKLDCVVVYKPLPLKKSLSTKRQVVAELESFIKTL